MSEHTPIISIISVVFNRIHDIEYTLESISQQTYPKIEYIVIDGDSTDGTLAVLQKYSGFIHIFISEKDNGIYDAMNKGLSIATGEYVLFINGGDTLHHKSTLENIVTKHLSDNSFRPDIIYGECMLIDRDRKPIQTRSTFKKQIFPQTLDYYSFKMGTNVSHQSFIVKRTIAPLYDLSYRWSSDVDWMLKCIKNANFIISYQEIISDFVIGDSTEKNKVNSLKERFHIMNKHYGLAKTLYFHSIIMIKKLKEILF